MNKAHHVDITLIMKSVGFILSATLLDSESVTAAVFSVTQTLVLLPTSALL